MDFQPDLYYFNFLGYSGQLGFDDNGDFFTYPDYNFKFVGNPLDATSGQWEIIDALGVKYIFGSATTNDGIEKVDYHLELGWNPVFEEVYVPTSWYLTKITSADDAEEIVLEYTTSTQEYTRSFGYINETELSDDCYNPDPPDLPTDPPDLIVDTEVTNTVKTQGKGVLSRIITSTGSVEFLTTSNRTDVQFGQELDEIVFKNKDALVLGSFEFTYDFQMSRNRLFLTSLVEKDGSNVMLPSYDFTYYLPNATDDGNPLKKYSRDYWGFFNGFVGPSEDRDPNDKSEAWSLKSIKYPEGAKIEFVYESNEYRFVEGNSNETAGGIRIKQVKTYETASATTPTTDQFYEYKNYEVGLGSNSSGVLNYHPKDNEKTAYKHFNHHPSNTNFCWIEVEIQQNRGFFGQNIGSDVTYSHVTVYNQSKDLNLNGNAYEGNEIGQLGKIEYAFHITNSPHSIENASLKHQTEYTRFGTGQDDYRKVRKTSYSYVLKPGTYKTTKSLEVLREEYDKFVSSPGTEFSYDVIHRFLTKFQYISSMTNTFYDGNDDAKYVETTSSYHYDGTNHNLLTKETYVDENSDLFESRYKYPLDISGATGATLALQQKNMLQVPLETIRLKNGEVIAASKTDYTLLNPAETDINKKRVYPGVAYAAELANPVLLATFEAGNYYNTTATFNQYTDYGQVKEITGSDGIVTSSLFNTDHTLLVARATNTAADKVFYESFEEGTTSGVTAKTGTKYRSTSYTKSGLPSGDYKVSFWARKSGGGNGTISGSGVTKTISSSEWQYYEWDLTNVTSVTLNPSGAYMDELRIHPPIALMTTFNYDNQYRKIDETGVNNITVYFTYDGFGRLIQQKDHNRNLLTEHEYQLGY